MADQKLTDKTALINIDDADLLHTVDVSDTTDDPAGTSKKITWGNLKSGLGATLETQVTQTAHGLVVGDWVRMDGGNFVKALADTATNAPAIGYVKTVTDANTFTYQYGGLVAIAGLTAGGSYFLQDDGSIGTTAGTINLFVGTETPQGFLLEIGQGFEEGDDEIKPEVLGLAFGDETSDMQVGTDKLTFQMPNFATILLGVSVNVKTAPTGSVATFDLNEGGVSVLSTKITIDAGETTSETAGTPPVISDNAIAANAVMTVDIDTIGSTIAGVAPKIWIYYTRA